MVDAFEEPNVKVPGPVTLVHAYDMTVPSASDPLPTRVVEFAGNVIVISDPALAVGGWFVAAFTEHIFYR